MDNKAGMLMLFYTLLVIVFILKHKHILKMDRKNMLFIGLSLSLLLVIPLLSKVYVKESFVEDQSNNEEAVDYIKNIKHIDNLLDVIDVHKSDVVCYFSTFQIDSFNPENGLLHNLKNSVNDNYLKLIKQGNTVDYRITDFINQERGISLHEAQLEGYECDKLNLNGMREFSMFWFVKFDFTMTDYDTLGKLYNLFEMYSSNVTGGIALSIKLELKIVENDTIETFIINYAGLEFRYEFNHASRLSNRLNFNNGTHLLTFVKYIDGNKHKLKMTIDEERFLLNPADITTDNISYLNASGTNSIKLSREKFIMNKRSEGSNSNTHEYLSMKMYLMAFGIFKRAIHTTNQSSNIISTINMNLRQQKNIQLSDIFLTTQSELTKRIEESEEYLDKSKCKFNNIICQECEDVDWADISSLASSPACLTEVKKYCKNIKDNVVTDYTEYQKRICDLIHTESTELILSNISSNLIEHTCRTYIDQNSNYGRTRFPGLRTIIADNVPDNDYRNNMNSNNVIVPPEYIQQDHFSRISTSNLVSSVPSFDNVSNDILNRSIGNLSYDDIVRIAEAIKDSNSNNNSQSSSSNSNNSTSNSSTTDDSELRREADLLNTKRYESIMNEYRSVQEEMEKIEKDDEEDKESYSFMGYFKNLFRFT